MTLHDKAWAFFGYPTLESHRGLVLHHVDITLKTRDPKRYNEWRPEDLVVMDKLEHLAYHSQGERNGMYGKPCKEETKQKISAKNKGKSLPHTDEWNKKISEATKGRINLPNKGSSGLHWYNNGEINRMFADDEAPEGWVRKKLPHKVPAWNRGLHKGGDAHDKLNT